MKPNLPTERVELSALRPHPKNARNGDTEAIAESLQANGQFRAIVCAKDGTILAGNHTYSAALELGWTHLDIHRLEIGPDSEEATRIMLADNRTSDLGRYDDGLLRNLLEELPTLDGTGYDEGDLDEVLQRINNAGAKDSPWDDRELRERDANPITKTGDRWILGRHTLTCADSTTPEAWEGCPPLAGMVTDPPYGIDYDGGGGLERERIAGDASGTEAASLVKAMYAIAPLKAGAVAYTFTASGVDGLDVMDAIRDSGLYKWGLVWVKNNATFGRSDYHQQHEIVVYGWKEGGAHLKVKDRTRTTVLEFDRPSESKDHPTQKPVALIHNLLTAHAWPKDAVIGDAFSGSGTLMEASEQLNLATWLVEREPAYCDVIARRYQLLTGTQPILQSTGEAHDFFATK